MRENVVLKGKYQKIKENFLEKQTFTLLEAKKLFLETNPKTVSWDLYNMVQKKMIYKIGHGVYSLYKENENLSLGYEYFSKKTKAIYDKLQEYGYKTYISGIDVLNDELLHIPENYPVIVVVEKNGIDEVRDYLFGNNYNVITKKDKDIINHDFYNNKIDAIILAGEDFKLSCEGIAIKEKAFLDLYYVVTRFNYKFSVQELIRTYESMLRKNTMLKTILKKAALENNIKSEIEYIMGLKNIPQKAREFTKRYLEVIDSEI